MLVLALSNAALAGTPAHYHPDNVAAASTAFRASADELAPAFDAAQTTLAALGKDKDTLEMGVSLLGDHAPEALQAWSVQVKEAVAVQYLQTQHHVNVIQDGYGTIFGAALQRAIEAQGGHTLVECLSGSGLSAMMRRSSSGDCEGDDLNAVLAQALDADATLSAELSGLTGSAWPSLGISGEVQAAVPITGTGRDVDVSALGKALIGDLLIRRLEVFEDALAPLEEDLDSGDTDALARAQGLRADYEAQLAADGAALIEAVTAAIERAGKKNNIDNIGLCANPAGLGGCGGEESSAEVYDLIREDRKLEKSIDRISGS